MDINMFLVQMCKNQSDCYGNNHKHKILDRHAMNARPYSAKMNEIWCAAGK